MKKQTIDRYIVEIKQHQQKKLTDSVMVEVERVNRSLLKTEELNRLGFYARELGSLIEAGKLERVKHGYYRLADEEGESSEAKTVLQLYPDGIVCMSTALFHYGYSHRTPLAWDLAVDRNTSKARFNLDYPYVKPYYMEKAHMQYGVTTADFETYPLRIFDRDRLICECIKHENKMDKELYNGAIISYINDSQKNISALLDYAKERNIHKKVRERIGVWL